jgi:hypothetical protein
LFDQALDEGKEWTAMKKLYAIGFALAAVLALCAFAATAAFAESEFLVGGAPALEGQEAHSEGELELTDLVSLLGETVVLCSGLSTGKFVSANDALVEKLFDLGGVEAQELPGGAIVCTNVSKCPSPLVNVDNLPWLTEIVLDANGSLLLHLTESTKGLPGWDVTCMGVLGEPSVLCQGLVSGRTENLPLEKDFDVVFSLAEQETEKELGTCFEGTTERKEVAHLDGTLLALPVGAEGLEVSVS